MLHNLANKRHFLAEVSHFRETEINLRAFSLIDDSLGKGPITPATWMLVDHLLGIVRESILTNGIVWEQYTRVHGCLKLSELNELFGQFIKQ